MGGAWTNDLHTKIFERSTNQQHGSEPASLSHDSVAMSNSASDGKGELRADPSGFPPPRLSNSCSPELPAESSYPMW